MRYVRTLGLCLVAVFAFSAVAAATASAARPEYKKCAKAGKETVEWKEGAPPHEKAKKKAVYTGAWENKECTKEDTTDVYRSKGANPGPEGKYEQLEVAEPFTSKSKTATFTFTAGGKPVTVICKKDTDAGEILDQFTDTEKITFSDCTISGTKTKCGNVAEGTIETEQLTSNLYFLNEGETEDGVALANEETGVFASFKCGSETITLEGFLLGSVTNDGTKGETITFTTNGSGEQAHKGVWFGDHELGPLSLESEGQEATLTTTDEQGPKDVGVYPA